MIAALATLLLQLQPPEDSKSAPKNEEKVLLRTTAGDIVLALDPAVAPRTVQQVLRMVELGIYDGSPFSRIEPGFLIQLAGPFDRREPLSDKQKAAVQPIPREPNSLLHTVWSVNMARPDDNPDAGMGSICIFLNNSPHLDGKYTVFGRVEAGFEVVDLIARLKGATAGPPRVRVEVTRARRIVPPESLRPIERRSVMVPPEGLGPEYILLRTNAGDMVLALYPDVAPNHAMRLLHMARNGVYDSSDFCFAQAGQIVQLSGLSGRRLETTPQHTAAVSPLPAEFSMLPHRRGTLSMARDEGKPDSATSSFCILLNDAPQLNTKYTVFGHVLEGLEVADAIAEWKARAPAWRPEILEARIVAREQLPRISLLKASPPVWIAKLEERMTRVTLGWLGILLAGSVVSFLPARFLSRGLRTACLLLIFVGGFFLFGATVTHSTYAKTPVLPIATMFGAALFFRIMSGFEGQKTKP